MLEQKQETNIRKLYELCNDISDILFFSDDEKEQVNILQKLANLANEDQRVYVLLKHDDLYPRFLKVASSYASSQKITPNHILAMASGAAAFCIV